MPVDMLPLISFVIVTTFTPGPNNISSAAMGIAFGYRRTLPYLFGITAGLKQHEWGEALVNKTLLCDDGLSNHPF